ncbi:MAG: N-acetylmuramoyl-L-alanine amidase family protein, partial [Brotaphodocola sp.]
MRKQTKLVAVASAAALLAIGASMTSFAATGWVEEDGQWYYYDKDGNKVEDEWKKSGENWYWLDSEEGGAMAVDKLIEDDDDTYYVDANGVMVKNTWVKVVNEDQDEDDDPAEYRYYYMQNNGKAYTAPDDGETSFKTIDGKRYAFDEDGKMLYGWVKEEDATLATDDSDWEDCTYYLGSWEDGAMKTGWQKITVYDQDEDEDMDYWFNFKSNGKVRKSVNEKKLNGKYYRFDERGVMVYEWALASGADGASVNDWMYFSNPEDGARKTKGWFKVVAPDDDNDNTFRDYDVAGFAPGDADDESERWYYADGDGDLYHSIIKKINGKYYGFYPEGTNKSGSMLTGLCALITDGDKIVKVIERDMDADDLDDCMDGKGIYAEMYGNPNASLFYFGNDEDSDGAMKTGATTINLDGDSYSFYFNKSGGAESKGKGWTGIDDNKYIYKFGLKMKADSDDKYKVVYATGDTGSDNVVVEEVDSAKLRKLAEEA